MEERPILFFAPMVHAILDGRKTQTRRLLRDQDPIDLGASNHGSHLSRREVHDHGKLVGHRMAAVNCPFGQPGDRLWVRETWRQAYPKTAYSSGVIYRADAPRALGMDEYSERHTWKPSIFMPRWASRITLEVTGVRVERLHDISEADALDEGVDDGIGPPCNPRDRFSRLWQILNAKRAPWASNPWVWVVEFRMAK